MKRILLERKSVVLTQLLPPHKLTVSAVVQAEGISEATLYIYGLPPFCKYRIWFWVVAYIYPEQLVQWKQDFP